MYKSEVQCEMCLGFLPGIIYYMLYLLAGFVCCYSEQRTANPTEECNVKCSGSVTHPITPTLDPGILSLDLSPFFFLLSSFGVEWSF